MKKIVALDCETTGLDPYNDAIIELCLIELDQELEPLREWSTLIKPHAKISKESREIHGISDEELEDAPIFKDLAEKIQGWVEDAILVAHNHLFDCEILHSELTRAGQKGLKWDFAFIDTLFLERMVNAHTLSATYARYFGKDFENTHRAKSDTLATVEILKAQRERHRDQIGFSVQELESRSASSSTRTKRLLGSHNKFSVTTDGTVLFNFGKHRGAKALEHVGYLKWMLQKDFEPAVVSIVNQLIAEAEKEE